MTTHAVQKTSAHRINASGSLYRGESRMIIHSERNATVKKCAKRTSGFLSMPPRRLTGVSYIPMEKYWKQPRWRALRLSSARG